MKPRPVKIGTPWVYGDAQTVTLGSRVYNVNVALLLSEDLAVEVVPLRYLYLDYDSPCSNCLLHFAEHMKQCLEVDMDYPILLNDMGGIIDGRHRVIKALIEEYPTIRVRRFDVDPDACYTYVKDGQDG